MAEEGQYFGKHGNYDFFNFNCFYVCVLSESLKDSLLEFEKACHLFWAKLERAAGALQWEKTGMCLCATSLLWLLS